MNDNGKIRLLTPENDMRVKAFFSLLEDLSSRVEKYATIINRHWTGNAIIRTKNWR